MQHNPVTELQLNKNAENCACSEHLEVALKRGSMQAMYCCSMLFTSLL